MSGLLVRETHHVLSALDHALLGIWTLWILHQDRREQKDQRVHGHAPVTVQLSGTSRLDGGASLREAAASTASYFVQAPPVASASINF